MKMSSIRILTYQRHGNTGGRDHNLSASDAAEVCPTVRAVELAPGVAVTQACEGHICLGVPFGTSTYVRRAALATVQAHDQRLRAIVHLANYEGQEVMKGTGRSTHNYITTVDGGDSVAVG